MIVVTIRGKKIEVGVFDNGYFHAEIGGVQHSAESLELLKQKLMFATRASISIPFCRWDGKKVVNGKITGRHASNSNYLVKIDGEKVQQETHWGNRKAPDYLVPLTPVEVRDYTEMQTQRAELNKRIYAFEEEHGFLVMEAVEKAYEGKED